MSTSECAADYNEKHDNFCHYSDNEEQPENATVERYRCKKETCNVTKTRYLYNTSTFDKQKYGPVREIWGLTHAFVKRKVLHQTIKVPYISATRH